MNKSSYWKINLIILTSLLLIWFLVSFGFGILLSEALDKIKIGGFKLLIASSIFDLLVVLILNTISFLLVPKLSIISYSISIS